MLRRWVESVNLLLLGITTAINALETQFWAIIVLIIGCGMLIGTKHFGIDTTVAGGVIGVASNMLTGQIKKAVSDVTNTNTSETKTATAATASETVTSPAPLNPTSAGNE